MRIILAIMTLALLYGCGDKDKGVFSPAKRYEGTIGEQGSLFYGGCILTLDGNTYTFATGAHDGTKPARMLKDYRGRFVYDKDTHIIIFAKAGETKQTSSDLWVKVDDVGLWIPLEYIMRTDNGDILSRPNNFNLFVKLSLVTDR